MSANTEQRRLAAIMFTDMVGYSALTQRDETLALDLLQEHHDLLRDILPMFEGREIKSTGDGLLIEFSSALAAVQCAVEIQRTLAERNERKPEERLIQIRIGIHLGDVVWRGNDVLGDGVNIAARIEPLAEPGGVCITRAVFEQIANKVPQPCVQLSKPELKNISANVEVYKLVLDASPADVKTAESSRKQLYWVVLGVVVLNMVLFLKFGLDHKTAPPSNTNPVPVAATTNTDLKSIAVLPFINMSADKADEYLSDGMTEELLNVLARVPGLRVPGRSSSFAFKGKTVDNIFRKVGEQLHVTTVLEGSVRKAGDKLRITAQLINVSDGFHLWSETYDRDMTNIFAIQSDIAARVAEALKVQLLGADEQRKNPTENIEAYKLYLQGRQCWSRRTGDSITQAIGYFNQAIAADPVYALAYSGLADCYVILNQYAGLPSRETVPKARAAALRAIELDDRLGGPHATLALIQMAIDWDLRGAEAGFRRAIKMNPNYASAHHWLAIDLLSQGRSKDALAEIQRAQDIDPLSPIINVVLARVQFETGNEDLGIQLLQKQIALDPGFANTHSRLGDLYLRQGRLAEAIRELESAHQLSGKSSYESGIMGLAYARASRTNDAQQVLDQLLDLQSQGQDASTDIALIQHGLGNDAQALDWLEKAAESRASNLTDVYNLNRSTFWKDLRQHPRFQAILKRMNLVK